MDDQLAADLHKSAIVLIVLAVVQVQLELFVLLQDQVLALREYLLLQGCKQRRQGSFSSEHNRFSLYEVKAAIEGPVVGDGDVVSLVVENLGLVAVDYVGKVLCDFLAVGLQENEGVRLLELLETHDQLLTRVRAVS